MGKWFSVVALCVLFGASAWSVPKENADPRALEQFIKGNAAAQQGNPYQAIYFFEEAIGFDPDAPFLHVAIAEQYLVLAQENNSSEAISRAEEHLTIALKLAPDHVSAMELKARLLAAQGKTKQAKLIYDRLLSADSTNDNYRIEQLGICLTTGEFDLVDSLYHILNFGESANLDLTRRVVAVYLMTGQSARAIPLMEELENADSLDAAVSYTLGTLYLQTEDTARAIAAVDRAVLLDSTDTRFWYLKLVLEFDRNHFTNVLSFAEQARICAGEDARSANLEGVSHLRLADSLRAMERFTRALELDSTLYSAAGSLALLYDAQDSVSRSEDYYEYALRYSDSAAIYLNNYAYMYAVRGIELERAMEMVDLALVKEPANASYLDTKGWVHFQLKDYREALRWIKKALKIDPESGALLEHVGDVYNAMGKNAQARSNWTTAFELSPDSQTLKEKLGQ